MFSDYSFSRQAQQPKKVPRLGYLATGYTASNSTRVEAIRLALRERGYVEGQNIASEYRYAEGKRDRYSELAGELVRHKVDIIVAAGGDPLIQAAKNAGITTPVVFAAVTDPLGYGLIESLARPGGNITGLALALGEGFSGKWIELLKETVPKVARVAVLRNPTHPLAEVFLRETQAASQADRVRLDFFEARDPAQLGSALSRMEKERAKALIVTPDTLFSIQRSHIMVFLARRRLPSIFFSKEFVDAGGLMA